MQGRSGVCKAWARVAQVSLFVFLGIVSARCYSQNSSTTALAATQAIERAAESAQISSNGMTRLVELRKETGVKQAIAIKLSIPAFAGGRVKIHLPGLIEVGISKLYETVSKNGDRAWHGITDSGGDVTLIISRASIEGHIVEQGKSYQLVLLDGEVHAVLLKDLDFHIPTHKPQKTGALPMPMPMPGPPSYQPKPAESFSPLATASLTIRIFVAYTPVGEQRT